LAINQLDKVLCSKNVPGKHFGAESMKLSKLNLKSLSIDDLWSLHEQVGAALSEKITAEKRGLEERLARLNGRVIERPGVSRAALKTHERRVGRRKYPPVLPKYRNPTDPSETWAGRGKQPRWLVSQLKAGKKIDDFLIDRAKRHATAKRRSA
jgi:DNA-binding protein H-NS